MAKLSSDYFQYEVIQALSGDEIYLFYCPSKDWRTDFKNQTFKLKTFFLAGRRSVQGLKNHMDSLTDEQCGSFFGMRWDEKNQRWKERGEK